MSSDQFARLKEVLPELGELSESERAAYLDDACSDEPEIQAKVESILADETDGSSLGIATAACARDRMRVSESNVGEHRSPTR